MKIDLTKFENLINEHKLREQWRDSLFPLSKVEQDKREKQKYEQAKGNYIKMIQSPKNDGGTGYLNWALEASLGVKPSKARNRASLNGKRRGF